MVIGYHNNSSQREEFCALKYWNALKLQTQIQISFAVQKNPLFFCFCSSFQIQISFLIWIEINKLFKTKPENREKTLQLSFYQIFFILKLSFSTTTTTKKIRFPRFFLQLYSCFYYFELVFIYGQENKK